MQFWQRGVWDLEDHKFGDGLYSEPSYRYVHFDNILFRKRGADTTKLHSRAQLKKAGYEDSEYPKWLTIKIYIYITMKLILWIKNYYLL